MNTLQISLLRVMATLLVTIPMFSCSPTSPPTTEEQQSQPTATNAVEVQPTPVVEVEATPVVEETPAPPDEETAIPATPAQPPVDENWVQQSYGEAWSIGYPADWMVNDAGAHEGALQLEGSYEGHSYSVTYSYPMGVLADSLEAWVNEMLLPLTLEQREALVISDVMVANTPAQKVLNVPSPDGVTTSHHVYIWRSEGKNPRLITITQTDGAPVDAVLMDQLLDRLLVTIQ
jgi:hypothetical protein